MAPVSSEDLLPAGRIVRWLLLAGVILFSVGLYFRYGRTVTPLGAAPSSEAAPTTSPTR